MPGHEGIIGNEQANDEAKKAAHGDSSPQQLLLALCARELLDS